MVWHQKPTAILNTSHNMDKSGRMTDGQLAHLLLRC